MSLEEIIETVERIGEADEERREMFQQEYERFESNDTETFSETRDRIATERQLLDDLDDLLAKERENVEELVDYSEFLSVDQAVNHRDEAIEKLNEHNRRLESFRESLIQALDDIESNVNALEDGREVEKDPQPHLEAAHDAIVAHNDAVDGLDDNLTILNAYLV